MIICTCNVCVCVCVCWNCTWNACVETVLWNVYTTNRVNKIQMALNKELFSNSIFLKKFVKKIKILPLRVRILPLVLIGCRKPLLSFFLIDDSLETVIGVHAFDEIAVLDSQSLSSHCVLEGFCLFWIYYFVCKFCFELCKNYVWNLLALYICN